LNYDRHSIGVRYSAGHREATRARILEAAGRLFRARGYAATGIDAVMSAAELTAGAFYSHFASKEALFAETMRTTLAATTRRWAELGAEVDESARPRFFVERYLSPEHRDQMETGCAMASLAAEAARAGEETQRAVETEWKGYLDGMEACLRGPRRAERAIAIFAVCVGGIVLSRAVSDAALSDRILKACKRAALGLADPADA
jgi:TetR/AcrR family transcriptional regulator, transcriptional repressor for nem operon